jgi:hypothetical protein
MMKQGAADHSAAPFAFSGSFFGCADKRCRVSSDMLD